MNVFTSARPRCGACSKYCRRTWGAHSSSTILGFQDLPQNSVNHRSTIALLSQRVDLAVPNACVLTGAAATLLATAHAAANSAFRPYVRRGVECGMRVTRFKPVSPPVEPRVRLSAGTEFPLVCRLIQSTRKQRASREMG